MHADPKRAVSDYTKLRATYGILYTIVDILAAICFIAGSILFLNESTARTGTFAFLFGSIFFVLRPTIRLAREFHLWRLGRLAELAKDGTP